jgi:CRP-like cAMP-binding protein
MSLTDHDTAIAGFRSGSSASGDQLAPENWNDADWRELFRFTSVRKINAGDTLIRRGDPDRTLYFILGGELEVVVHSGDGMSMGPLTRIGAGSVLGEQSFFDGSPRSASVWATGQCEVAAMSPEQYAAFESASPARAHQLIFALARVLAVRLRRTTAKVRS